LPKPTSCPPLPKPAWRDILNKIWGLNRVHVGPEMSRACRILAQSYQQCRIIGFESGEWAGSWQVPPAWIVEQARLTGPDGRILADVEASPLALWAYSPQFSGTVSLAELEAHLSSSPSRPDALPFYFRNQYRFWAPQWGFSLPHSLRQSLVDGAYGVEIVTRFEDGRLEMVEQVHAGESADSLLLVASLDHPCQCGNGLAACLVGHEVLRRMVGRRTRLSYRMLSTVEIVGSVFYASHEAPGAGIREALVLAGLGSPAPLSYQGSCAGNAAVDRALSHVLDFADEAVSRVAYRHGGFNKDESAFEASGIRIPCGSLMRHPIPTHDTSDDTPETIDDVVFERSVTILIRLIEVFEGNGRLEPRFSGLPCLSHPELDLYLAKPTAGGAVEVADTPWGRLLARLPDDMARTQCQALPGRAFALLMTLASSLADGRSTILDLAIRAGVPFTVALAYVSLWVDKGLLDIRWVSPFDEAGRSRQGDRA
jgi:aminopeptidase-like protein